MWGKNEGGGAQKLLHPLILLPFQKRWGGNITCEQVSFSLHLNFIRKDSIIKKGQEHILEVLTDIKVLFEIVEDCTRHLQNYFHLYHFPSAVVLDLPALQVSPPR